MDLNGTGSPQPALLGEYLQDESRYTGWAESISFPHSEEEIAEQLAEARALNRPVTVQGARTGITGGAVPEGGHVLNLSRMKGLGDLRRDRTLVSVEPGVPLSDLRRFVHEGTSGALFFPPDPTETSASIGGMIACNASGACSFAYGPTRRYVESLRVVLADGSAAELRRGVHRAQGRRFEIQTDSGERIRGELPSYAMPAVKNAAGYHAGDDLDLVDLFIGAEGTLGVITRAELRLVPSPPARAALIAFLPGDEAALNLVESVRGAGAAALEFFDQQAISLLRTPGGWQFSERLPGGSSALYVEYHGRDESIVEAKLIELSDGIENAGGSADQAWLASGEREMQQLKAFRHAVPEAINRLVAEYKKSEPSLTKLGTDLAVPQGQLRTMMDLYREGLQKSGLLYVVFGHIGDNHLHVNILPRNKAEYERGYELYTKWAAAAVELGGTVSAEHGIGKLKRSFLRQMYGDAGIVEMRRLKSRFDPSGLLNRGNLFQP
jgi:D-lactate dehydrogenase (cytochrome)